MATYIVLCRLTQQGRQTIKGLPQRRDGARERATALGITLRERLVTIGQYDIVIVLDAPSDEAVVKFTMQLGMEGNLSTETLRAFNQVDADRIISSLP
jgi:uncharacterized protein with GYD domain